jgi:hypothetical protein
MKAPAQFFDEGIEPKALCRNCEYYNGNGFLPNGEPREDNGECTNTRAPRFQTTMADTCPQFFPCSLRWPEADHD